MIRPAFGEKGHIAASSLTVEDQRSKANNSVQISTHLTP